MASIKSRDFVGIAEGIKTHELSTKGKIESLKNTLSELNGRKNYIESNIASLEAALAAAYEDTDEDGEPDYSLISSIESQLRSAENELSGVTEEISDNNGELAQTQMEYESVQEEKARTLFEIQERARQTSSNISVAGGMYGAYAGVSSTLQSSLKSSLSSLTQAASILGGNVNSAIGGTSSGGSSNTTSGDVGGNSSLSNSSLSAFSSEGANEIDGYPTEKYHSEKTEHMTPASTPNFHSGQKTINPQKNLSFKTEQEPNEYATSSFSENESESEQGETFKFKSNQNTSNTENNFSSVNSQRSPFQEKREKFLSSLHYEIDHSQINKTFVSGNSSSDTTRGQRELADELERGFSFSTFGLNGRKKVSKNTASQTNNTIKSAKEQRAEFVQRMKAPTPIAKPVNNSSTSSDTMKDPKQRDISKELSYGERHSLLAFGLGSRKEFSDNSREIKNQILSKRTESFSSKNQLLKQPRSLSKTAQTWNKTVDGTRIYNAPHETGSKLDFHQGKVQNFEGTCGLVSCENILRLAGVPISENEIVKYASSTYEVDDGSFTSSLKRQTLCRTNSDSQSNGGTSALSRRKILEHYGISSYTSKQSINIIADAVSSGRGVIASVHAETLYFKRRPIHPDLHAVTVTSVHKDVDGSILGFYICDSNAYAYGGTGATYYTAKEFEDALSERECNITSTIIR